MTQSQRKLNVYLALSFFIILFLQLTLSRQNEPYPAILMPAGAGQTSTPNFYSIPEYELFVHFENNQTYMINKYELFDNVPHGFMAFSYKFLPKLFEKENEVKNNFFEERKSWLRSRLESITKRSDVSHIEIQGYIYNYFLKDGKIDSLSKQLVFDSLHIDLND